jgi:hypothetical protein
VEITTACAAEDEPDGKDGAGKAEDGPAEDEPGGPAEDEPDGPAENELDEKDGACEAEDGRAADGAEDGACGAEEKLAAGVVLGAAAIPCRQAGGS